MSSLNSKSLIKNRITKLKLYSKRVMILLVLLTLSISIYPFIPATYNSKRIKENDLEVLKFPREGAQDNSISPIRIFATYGDIFEPEINGINRAYDLIVLSATIDPLEVVDSMIYWRSNSLVRGFFEYARLSYDDPLMKLGVRGLILDMMRTNSQYFESLIKLNFPDIKKDKDILVDYCKPLLMRIPENSALLRKGIKWLAVLPLFDGKIIMDPVERKLKEELNVQTSIERLITIIKQRNLEIYYVAFPALAGSECLADSYMFLPYYDSFSHIIKAIKARPLPETCERFYLVAWNKWEKSKIPEEGERSVEALAQLYNENYFMNRGSSILTYIILALMGISYFFWILNEELKSTSDPSLWGDKYLLRLMQRYWIPLLLFSFTGLGFYIKYAQDISSFLSSMFSKTPFFLFVCLVLIMDAAVITISYAMVKAKGLSNTG